MTKIAREKKAEFSEAVKSDLLETALSHCQQQCRIESVLSEEERYRPSLKQSKEAV